MQIKSYRDLTLWQKAMELTVLCYERTERFPKHELYGLTQQLRRAAVSVPANVAEGHGREHIREFMHHLSTARGSLMELETHIVLAGRLGYLQPSAVQELSSGAAEVGRVLNGLLNSLRRKSSES